MEPVIVRIGRRLASVIDTGDGTAASRFGDALVRAGGHIVDSESASGPLTRIVIRTPLESPQARLRAEAIELDAELVLGSARSAFAERFVKACAPSANA